MTAFRSKALGAAATVLAGTFLALASASASAHDVYQGPATVRHGGPVYGPAQQVIVVDAAPVEVQPPPRRHYAHAGAMSGCAAPPWDPRVRYMPGQVVWQGGALWVASGLSAAVWNENSPPEWTPSYWVPAVCR